MKIKNAEQLRNFVLKSIEDLDHGIIDVEKLSIISKSAEAIFSSIKLELAYNNMRNEVPNIDFL